MDFRAVCSAPSLHPHSSVGLLHPSSSTTILIQSPGPSILQSRHRLISLGHLSHSGSSFHHGSSLNHFHNGSPFTGCLPFCTELSSTVRSSMELISPAVVVFSSVMKILCTSPFLNFILFIFYLFTEPGVTFLEG